MPSTGREHSETKVPGLVLHHAKLYDFTVWLMTLGRERAFREKILCLARLKPGESVLDVGCGTGSLAVAAKRHVGPTGIVKGIDASPEMIARAEKKAARARAEVAFQQLWLRHYRSRRRSSMWCSTRSCFITCRGRHAIGARGRCDTF